jgi:NTP pyrophosphatase (non-canonical NTP hydrolase)
MKNVQHSEMVTKLLKSGDKIRGELTGEDCNLIHLAMGVSGEAGELLDAIKKATIYRKAFDYGNVVEELGDIEFYLEGLRQALGLTREEILFQNISKLSKRYDGLTYTNEAAINRADKVQDDNWGQLGRRNQDGEDETCESCQ